MRSSNGSIIFVNGHVLTGGFDDSPATSVAIHQGKIVAVGTDSDAMEWASTTGAEVIDLAGRTISPGLNDAHCHPLYVGLGLANVDASSPPNKSVADIVVRIEQRVRQSEPGEWVQGRGYDQARLVDQRHPTRHDLDPVSPENPVVVVRACGHIAVANSYALRAAGVNRNTPDPTGGTIDRDEHGEPTGVLREHAQDLVRDNIPEPSLEQQKTALIVAGNEFLSKGVTSVGEAGVADPIHMQAYIDLNNAGELPVRTYLMMMIDETLDNLIQLGVSTGFGDEWLRVGPAKLFLDGSIGGHTARVRQPYEGEPDNYGLWMYDPAEIKQKMIKAHLAGFQLCAHAIGDGAIELLLDIYEEALEQLPRENHRHRIEHCSIIDLAIVHRIQRLGAIPIPGTTFLHDFNRAYIEALGWDRIRYAYGMNTFYEHGIVAAASTDAPVVDTSATLGLQTMMTRLSEEGLVMWEEEKISLNEAIRAYTWNGAYATFEEHLKGTLEPGKIGDVTVFETNISQVEAEAMGQVQVDYTVTDGYIAYAR